MDLSKPWGSFSRPGSSNRSLTTARTGKNSFAERIAAMSRPSTAPIVEGDSLLRGIDHAAPGDTVKSKRKSMLSPEQIKKRSSFFEEAFSTREVTNPVKERIRSEAIVMAEVRTNVIISDEFTFITELSYHLSSRYQRPVSSIVVTLQHGTCMLFGGTFDPAYVMSIYALPSQVGAITNKRNAAMIQKHMDEALGVNPSRGFLRFIPTKEEHVATNGKTMASEMDEIERGSGDEDQSIASRRDKARMRLSVKSFANFRHSMANVPAPELTPPASAGEPPAIPELTPENSTTAAADDPAALTAITAANTAANAAKASANKNLCTPTPKVTKRKSFVASIFGGRPPPPQ